MAVAYVYNTGGSGEDDHRMRREGVGSPTPAGLLVDAAGTAKDGSSDSTEVGESREAHDRFGDEVIMPAFQKYGIDPGGATIIEIEVENLQGVAVPSGV